MKNGNNTTMSCSIPNKVQYKYEKLSLFTDSNKGGGICQHFYSISGGICQHFYSISVLSIQKQVYPVIGLLL